MKFRNLIMFLTLVLSVSVLPLYCGNSIFSYQGSPWQYYGNDIYGMSMGDVGISDMTRKNLGFGNPAIVGNANETLFSTGIMFGWTGYKSENDQTYRDNSLDFPYFSVAIPIGKNRFGFQFNSYSSGTVENQRVFDAPIYSGDVIMDTLSITETQSVNRYLYRADLIYAYRFKKYSLGVALNYYLGHDIRRFYQDSGNGIFNTFEKTEKTYKNPSATIGATAEFGSVVLGSYYSKGPELDGEFIRSSIHETEEPVKEKDSIADQTGIGITWKLNDEYRLSTDFIYSFWSSAKNSAYDKDSWKMGIGIAQEPKSDTRKTILGQLSKRAGFSYRLLPFDSNGSQITETSVSAGVTVPVKNDNNRLDFGMQYLWRGNVNENALQDRSLMFMIGITGFDILSKPFTRKAPRDIPRAEELSE